MVKKKLLHLLKVISFLNLFFSVQAKLDEKIFIVALPKSGTHLLSSCVELITNKRLEFLKESLHSIKNKNLKELSPNNFLGTHAVYTKAHKKRLEKNTFKGVFIIRDPRDTIVSRAHWFKKRHPDNILSLDQLLMELIINYAHFDNYPEDVSHLNVKTLADAYQKLYLPWQQCPLIYTTRFELLVGPRGGGNIQAQITEIKNIAKHLSIELSETQIKEVADNVFDSTSITFKAGQIGSWKDHFKPNHKEAFKKVAAQLLITLGYEKNINW